MGAKYTVFAVSTKSNEATVHPSFTISQIIGML
jgi:hypothetical protein